MRFTSAISIFSFLACAYGAAIDKRATYPDQDPFYTPPAGWQSSQPGSILGSRNIQAAALGLVPTLSVLSYQLLYRTADQDGNPIATVTTIFVPALSDKKSLLAYGVPEDSGATKCAPSYQYQFGSDASNAIAQAELTSIQAALSQGWVVTVADHEGPNSAFIAGRLSGRAILDSIRATKAFTTINLASAVKTVMWGYSGGASAIGWAAALHSSYAPELNIVGAAHGGTPANLTAAALYLNKSGGAGFVAVSFYGLGAAYPAFRTRLAEVATPRYTEVETFVKANCGIDVVVKYSGTDFFSNGTYFKGDLALFQDPVIRPVLDSLLLGEGGRAETPDMPLLVYHAKNDQILPFAPASKMVDQYCSSGGTVQFVVNNDPSVGHALEEPLTVPRTIAFLRDRLAGVSISGCSRLDVGISSATAAAADAVSLGLPGLAPIVAAATGIFRALPAI